VTEHALKDATRPAAWRLHGGGFAGTIQAFVPHEDVSAYKVAMETVFGENACAVLRVRREGATKVL
jgi:galactokinase